MKEIQFRAWDKKNKKMYYGYEPDRPNMIDFDGNLCITGAGNRDEYGGPTDYISGCDQENYILMQYTGLRDKEGNEIYEGDIIEGEIWNYLFGYYIKVRLVVKWDEAGYWSYENEEYEFAGGYLSDVKNVVVIGNIYQNHELLKEE